LSGLEHFATAPNKKPPLLKRWHLRKHLAEISDGAVVGRKPMPVHSNAFRAVSPFREERVSNLSTGCAGFYREAESVLQLDRNLLNPFLPAASCEERGQRAGDTGRDAGNRRKTAEPCFK